MRLREHPGAVWVVRLAADAPHPEWARGLPLSSVSRSADELSVICPAASLPEDLPGPVQGPFTAVEVEGPLDLALTGVVAGLLKPLADAGLSILALSTYDTDWVLVPAAGVALARVAWTTAGHEVSTPDETTPDDSTPDSTPDRAPGGTA